MSKPLLTLATAMLVLTLIVSSAWIFNSAGVFAAGTDAVTASSLTNNNIGKHPLHALLSWDATGENLQSEGRFNWGAAVTGDYYTPSFTSKGITSNSETDEITPNFITTAVNTTLKDNGGDTILEQSPIFTYKRETVNVNGETYTIYVDTNGKAVYFDEVAQSIALKYGFREGKELVFNINDEGTAARVWSDAVLFTQHIGPAECIPFVSYVDYGRYRDTGLIPDTTMYAFAEGDYIFRTKLQPEEIEAGSVVYNEYSDKYGVWENYDKSKDGNADYLQNEGGTVQRFAHFFVNDNGSYYYNTDTKEMTTSASGNVQSYTTPGYAEAKPHIVKYSLYDPDYSIDDKHKGFADKNHAYNETNDPDLMPEKGTLNVHGPVYRGNYFIENGRYEGWGETSAYGGAKLMGQYITVRLNCDWTAKEITTNIYGVTGKTTTFDFVKTGEDTNAYKAENDAYVGKKKSEDVKIKYFTESTSGGYTLFYDASSIPFGTGNTPFTPYNELCAFSNGRINVPVGSYIVLDLNGHKIDRALSANYDKSAEDSAYQYFGSVFAVNEFARLEVYDGTAFENASDTHISGTNKDKPESNYGANGGLTTDQAGTITGGYVTHQFKKDGGNGRAVGEGSAKADIGDSNFKTQLSKLNIIDGVTRSNFTETIADENQAKGAAIHLFSHSDFVLHSGTIKGNNAASQYGGAVYLLTNSSMTMFDGYVINNQSYRIGGGIYLADSSASVLTMYNGVVGYNYGGAGELTIDESNDLREDGLRQFRAIENYGGGIALRTKAYCNLYGGELVGNYSYGPGAGMYIQSTAVGTLAGVTIKGNHTYGSPGGQGGSFAPFGGGGGIFVGGTGARIGFRGALQIVENYRDNTVNDYQGKALESPTDGEEVNIDPNDAKKGTTHVGTHKTITDIVYTPTNLNTRADNLYLPMREMTRDTKPTNPNTNGANEVGEKDGAKASTNYDKRWDSNATIVISGPLIEKGIVANIGITMQAATSYFNANDNTDKKLNEDGTTESSENIKLVFTQQYTKKGDSQHNDIDAHYFFTSDNPDYIINMDGGEAKLHKATPTETQLTWVVEGKGIDADTKTQDGAPVLSDLRVIVSPEGKLEYWYKNPNRSGRGDFQDTLAKVDASTKIESAEVELSNKEKTQELLKILNDSFVATSGSLDFEYSMLNVTKVAVYSDTPDFTATGTTQSPLATWEVTNTGSSFGINSTFYTSNFRFKLGEEDLEFKNTTEAEDETNAKVPDSSKMFKAIKATDESLSYAGLYSFLYKSKDTTRYTNPTFKINIKQVGIEATRTCYFDGKDVTKREPVPWQEDENFSWNIGTDPSKNREPNAPYFLYRGDYYYPVLSADYNNPVKGSELKTRYDAQGGLDGYIRPRLTEDTFFENEDYIRVVDPETPGDCLFVRKEAFNGYVLNFRYSNQYFGVKHQTITGGSSDPVDIAITTDVHFGAHDGGGVEYKTLHKKPGSEVAEGQYVDGVKHAGTYLVTFVASSNGLANDTGVYFASNNFAFNAEVRLQVKPANAEVQLTENARKNLGYFGTKYEDRQIAEFDNTSDTKIIPVNDDAVIFRYFLYDDEEIWKDNKKPSLEDLQKDVLAGDFKLKGDVTAQNYKEDGTPNTIPGAQVDPLNARTYIVVVTLELDMNYEEYDYVFTKDPAHLVNIDVIPEKQSNVWAYWFTIDPAEVDPYELIAGSSNSSDGNNTSVTITKDEYFKNVSYAYKYESGKFPGADGSRELADTANLPTIKFGNTELQLGTDYTVEYSGFAAEQKDGNFNYVDASVGLDASGPAFDGRNFGAYNLAVKITFGGKNKNYVNKKFTTGSADDNGTAYEDEKGAFYVYFRIVPVIVTASASISYTYDGGSYDRGRYLPPRVGKGEDDAWYESIFFLAQDSKVISQDIIEHQHDNRYDDAEGNDLLDELWGGVEDERGHDNSFYKKRYTIDKATTVSYSNSEFIDNGIRLGVGMYAFQTGNANATSSSYRLSTIDFDNKTSIDEEPDKGTPGVMWLLTVGNVQTHASTKTDGAKVTNFIINAESYLNVTINSKDITADDVKVTLNGADYDGTAEFPYSGHEYRPTVTLSYDVQRPTEAAGAHKTEEVKIATISIKADGNVEDDKDYDCFITYSNNVQTSTDALPASVQITANSTSRSSSKFSQNFYNSRSLEFKITPASVKVTIKDDDHIFTYNRKDHPVTLEYTNTTDYSAYAALLPAGFGTSVAKPLPLEQTEINIMYGEVGTDNKVPEGDGGRRDFVSTAPINAGRYRVAVHLNSTNFIYVADDYSENTDQFIRDSVDGSKDILTYNNSATSGKDTDLVIKPAIAYIGPGAAATTPDGHEIINQFTYNRTNQVPTVLSTNICEVNFADGAWKANYASTVVPASSSGDYTIKYTTDKDGSPNTDALSLDGFANAGTYWMILDMVSKNFIWGGYGVEVEGDIFTHKTLSNTRLAVQYTISPSEVVLKPNDSISGANYPEGQGTLHFTYDGTKHDVGVTLSSHTLSPLSTEFQLNPVSFKGSPSFTAGEAAYMSVYAGTYSFTVTFTDAAKKNYVWSSSQEAWENYNNAHANSVIVDEAGTGLNTGNKIVYVDLAKNTVTITYVIDPAKVYISSIDSKLYNREEQDDIAVNFKNEVETNSQVPTKYDISFKVSEDKNQWLYKNYDTDIAESEVNKANVPNAQLGVGDKPLNAGNYDVTVTLKDDDKNNFELVQQTEYKSSLNSNKEKTVTYTDGSADKTTAVALFVIEQLGVFANQEVSSNIFDNIDHFMGNPHGLSGEGRYGGVGPWTINFSSLDGETPLDGIGYNISFKGNDKDGQEYTVTVKIGGYSTDGGQTLLDDNFYLKVKDQDTANPSDFDEIKGKGFFTNAGEYTYTLYFEDANFFISTIGGKATEQELTFTINPAQIALGTLANKTFNNHEQEPVFDDNSFTAVGDTKFDEGTTIFGILDGYNTKESDSGFTFSYTLPEPHGNSQLKNGKPFNAGTYTVNVTLTNDNFRFSGSETSSTTFTIDPFDISSPEAAFSATLPDVRYTGMAMKTYIEQATLTIDGSSITLVLLTKDASEGKLLLGDNGYELTISRYNNNINVKRNTDGGMTVQKEAEAYIAGSGNFSGEIMRKFTIQPRDVNVHIESNKGNIYGLSLGGSEANTPSNLGKQKGVDWNIIPAEAAGGEGELSATRINELIEESIFASYGTANQEAINKAIEAFEKFNGSDAMKFMYDGDNLSVSLSIADGKYNTSDFVYKEGCALLVGEYKIAGYKGNDNYNVIFSGDYNTKKGLETPETAKYGYYQVVQREISITPADNSIVYGNAKHTYNNNEAGDTYLTWTATFDYDAQAILTADESVVKEGIALTIVGSDDYTGTNWLPVGTYKINATYTATLDDGDTTDDLVRACYIVKGIGTWVNDAEEGYAISSAAEAVATGTGGTYTVTARDITLNIMPDVLKYEYNHEEPNATRDILDYMLHTAKTKKQYEDIMSLKAGSTFAGGEDWEILKLKFIKDAGVNAATYSVSPSWNNPNYNVTFEGTSNSVTITPRKIIVHINDQTSVYGEKEVVNTAQGTTAAESTTANWYAMLSKDSSYWDADKYDGDDKLDARIGAGRLGDDDLNIILSKELGANVGKYYLSGTFNNSNYEVTFEGNWNKSISTTGSATSDPADKTAGIYNITVRPVTVTVLGQSGVYGAGQHISIGSTENTHWSAETGTVGLGEGVVNNDSLGISITIIPADGLNAKSNQLNVGWYSVRVSYNNPNYKVTFVSSTTNLNSAEYVKDYATHSTSAVTEYKATEDGPVTAYDVSNAYYIYARIISITVLPQSFTYSGEAPTLKQGKDWWSANNVINGDMPAILDGDVTDFNNAIKLIVVAPVEGDPMYATWKKWGMWSAGLYENKCGLQATLNDPDNKVLFGNYELVNGESSVLGALRISPAEITVTHNGQESTYNKKAPTIDQTSYTIDSEATKVFSSRQWNGSAFDEEATSDKGLLKFTFTFDGTDYGAGRHLIQGAWDGEANPNYTVTFNAGTYIINKRELQVTIKDQYGIYGETLWNGDDWWLDKPDEHGTQTPNEKYWSISVINPNADDNDVYWINETDRNALGISPDSKAQQSAGKYQIAGLYNNSDDYVVTFFGSWNASNPEKTNGTGGTYTVYKRAIKVHINDQSGEYGSFSGGAPVDQSDWTVVGFDSTKQQGICEGHECGEPTAPFVVASDNLNIVLSLEDVSVPGEYNIKGECRNANYEVTWVGGEENREEASGWDRDHGIFGLTKRQVTVNVVDQNIEYGKLKNGETTGFDANGYTAQAKNDTVNRNAFVTSDNVLIELSVVVRHSNERGNYNQAGNYIIHIRIYEGGKAGKLIYSSVQSEVATASDKYELTVGGDHDDEFFGGNGEVRGTTGAYEITKKDLYITVADKSSIYGEKLEDLTFTINGAMADDVTEIEGHVTLAIADKKFNDWDRETQTYLCAGTYHITATLDDATINNNYSVVFRTQNGADYKEAGPDGRGEVTAIYTVTKRMLAINVTYLNSIYGEDLADFEATLSPVGNLTGDPILEGDKLEVSFEIVGSDKNYNLSSAGKLKAGIYPILGSWNSNENYDISFTGVWTTDNTETWLNQATQNSNLYQDVEGGAHATLDRKAGVYTVSKRPINVTLGTENPSSEYGDPIKGLDTDDFHNTDKSWKFTYVGYVDGDIIAFEMTTAARQGSEAKAYDITVVDGSDAANDENDNVNYDITFKNGTYTIEPRLLTATLQANDDNNATDIYGTPYNQEAKFKYSYKRVNGDDPALYGEDKIELVITPIESGIYTKTETGFYPVGTYMLNITAGENKNYKFTSMEGTDVRYHVKQRPITIHVNDQHSVFGETINVDRKQGTDENGGGWYVVAGEIIQGNGHTDDLGINISKNDAGISYREGGYELTASASNGNYAVTFEGNWKDGQNGRYTIDKRLIRIHIHNQYSIYGENVRVSSENSAWEVVDPKEIAGGEGKYFTLLEGQTPNITLNIYITTDGGEKVWYNSDGVASASFMGVIDRGEYHIGVQIIGNANYDVEVEDDYLPDINGPKDREYLKTKFPKDFGNPTSKDTIEVVNPVISEDLAKSNNATYFVTIRPILVKINDQSGTYGDYLTLNQKEGTQEAYYVELGAGTTGTPFVGNYKATFDLVTTAFEGSNTAGAHPEGKNVGWSLNAGKYPIFGAAYHVFVDGDEKTGQEATELSHNYQFNFEGSYTGEETYPSGTTFSERAGVYTVVPREVTLSANPASATYGDDRIPTPAQNNYQSVVGNSNKASSPDGKSNGPILAKDLDGIHITLTIKYVDPTDLSQAKALKVGTYTLELSYTPNYNYSITAENSTFTVNARQAFITIVPKAATATYLAEIPSEWSVNEIGQLSDMYQLSNVLEGDVIVFTMTTNARRGKPVADDYVMQGEIGEGGDNKNYSITFTNGTFEITKKRVDVTIVNQTSEYGEIVNVDIADVWQLPEGWNADNGFTNHDSAEALGITLSTSATDMTDVGRYQIFGQYNANGEVGKNYDLHFVGSWNASAGTTNGDGGTLTIEPRAIVVVIMPQSIVYRDDVIVDQHAWFAWRDHKTAKWNGEDTEKEEGVLGPKDTLDALNVYLMKGNALDTEEYGENTGSGTYVGTYAIVGSHTATNYNIRFAYGRAEEESFNYSTVEEDENGTFTITPYEITIKILSIGGTSNVVKYGEYLFGAELANVQGTIWDYAVDGKEFLPAEVTYLSFSLGGDKIAQEADGVYAFVGAHPIVGYWGKTLENKSATDYRMKFNYKVTFTGDWNAYVNSPTEHGYDALYENEGETTYGSCGIITISNADVAQASYEREYEGNDWHGNNWNRFAAFSGTGEGSPTHSMKVGATDLSFAGDVAFDGHTVSIGAKGNKELEKKVTIKYSDLNKDDSPFAWTAGETAPAIQDVGRWTVKVTVQAPYHNEVSFTMTLTVSQLDITIYLSTEKISFVYGVYSRSRFADNSLSKILKDILFADGSAYIEDISGQEGLNGLEHTLTYLRENNEVIVSVSTRTNDASTGGYLNVGEYVLTISAGENMKIRFAEEYENVVITKKDLSADWSVTKDHKEQRTHVDGKPEYVYTFGNVEIAATPYVKESDIMSGDEVLKNDILHSSVFDYVIYAVKDGREELLVGAASVHDVGTYKIAIQVNNSTQGGNADIGNYNTPDDWVYIVIQPAKLVIVIGNQSSEYDGIAPTLSQEANKAWHIKPSVVGGAYPEVIPGTNEALSALGITLSFDGDAPVGAGSYGIIGSYSTSNYTIVFEGESGGTQGIYTIHPRNVRIKVSNFGFTYGDDIPTDLSSDTNKYKAVHIVDGEELTSDIAVLPSDDIELEFTISNPLHTATGYIKVGEYNVAMSYHNDNYNITFADEDGHLQNTGDYRQVKATITQRTLSVNIYDRPVEYGTLRTEISENYKFEGWAAKDGEKYGDKAPNFITFECYDAMTKSPLAVDKDFDAVGVYIIIGKVAKDDIGDNYAVDFRGEWKGVGQYTDEEYIGKAGRYEVTPRKISITIGNVSSQYGDALTDEDILGSVTLQDGANNKLAPGDKISDLHIKFSTEAIRIVEGQRRTNNASSASYEITVEDMENKNYEILSYARGSYTVTRREIVITLRGVSHPYGDDHPAHVAGLGYGDGWTAERYGDMSGEGIAYPEDAIRSQIKLGTTASERSAVGEYETFVSVYPSDMNYDVKNINEVKGKYSVTKRKVLLIINAQSSEYGEEHVLARSFEFRLNEASNKSDKPIAFDTDAINQLELHFTEDMSVRTPAGNYRIDATFMDNNYDVTIGGEYIDGERQYGKYVVEKRDIVIKLLGTQQSEYGDPVFVNSDESKGWIADRPSGKGGNTFVNGDKFELELTVFDSLGREIDSTFGVGSYAVIVKQVLTKDVAANYNITYEAQSGQAFDGTVSGHAGEAAAVYTIVTRKITVQFGGESEYGDPVKVNDISYRTGGKEGDAIVNGDDLGFSFEWGAMGDPTNGGTRLADVGQYALKLKTTTNADTDKARANYDITLDENSYYHVVARKVHVYVEDIRKTYGEEYEDTNSKKELLLHVSRATEGATGDAILNNDIQFFSLSVANGDNILLTNGIPVHAGVYNYRLIYTDNNRNYEIDVEYGHYIIVPKPITVTIDSKTSKYSEDIQALTHGEVRGLIGYDDLYITLSVLWLDEELGLEWHNAGVYAIKGVWDNPDYAVTFKGDMGEFGKYTIEKADNLFTKEYDGNGTVYMGDSFRDGDLPTALWGNDSLRLEFYSDEQMNHKADFTDITDALEGTYYVKVIVDEDVNWKGATTSFTINIVDEMSFEDGMDVTAYVCVFASQFIILACALIFIRRKKDKKNKKI